MIHHHQDVTNSTACPLRTLKCDWLTEKHDDVNRRRSSHRNDVRIDRAQFTHNLPVGCFESTGSIKCIICVVSRDTRYLRKILHCFYKVILKRNFEIMSYVRQRYHEECEIALNEQINMELYASYVYLSMAYYFDASDVALPGLHKYFKKASDEEREHAMKFLKYQNKRGGNVRLTPIRAPPEEKWGSALNAMTKALDLERNVNESLWQLHAIAAKCKDANFMDFLETEFLQEQVDSIKEIADHITNLERVGDDLGVYIFDKELEKCN